MGTETLPMILSTREFSCCCLVQQQQQRGSSSSSSGSGRTVALNMAECVAERVAELQANLGMTNMKIAVRFRREPGHHLPASCLEVRLQLGRSVGNAHLTPARLRAECHHLVNLQCIHCMNAKQAASENNEYFAYRVVQTKTAWADLADRRPSSD